MMLVGRFFDGRRDLNIGCTLCEPPFNCLVSEVVVSYICSFGCCMLHCRPEGLSYLWPHSYLGYARFLDGRDISIHATGSLTVCNHQSPRSFRTIAIYLGLTRMGTGRYLNGVVLRYRLQSTGGAGWIGSMQSIHHHEMRHE